MYLYKKLLSYRVNVGSSLVNNATFPKHLDPWKLLIIYETPISPYPPKHLFVFVLFIYKFLAFLISVYLFIIVVFIFISQISNVFEQLFIYMNQPFEYHFCKVPAQIFCPFIIRQPIFFLIKF